MAHVLKNLSKDAIPRALEKADRYRLLNEPVQAESICLDILRTEPENQRALIVLLLALTDQFGRGYKMGEIDPREIVASLTSEYEREYYAGILAERQAKAALDQNSPRAQHVAYDLLEAALEHYERAGAMSVAGNEDAALRWNTCVRMINSRGVKARGHEPDEAFLE